MDDGGLTKAMERRASLGRLDQVQPLLLISAIGLGLGLAWAFPSNAAGVGWLVKVGVFLVIYLVMLGVDERGVLRAFTRLKPTSIALALNFVFTPVFAWFLGYVFLHAQPDIWVGLILYLVTPCIGWYLVFTDLADGDVELGVSLLFWNIALQILLLPIYLYFLAGQIVTVDVWAILQSLALFLVLPYALAYLTRRIWQVTSGTGLTDQLPLSLLKTVILMVVIAAMFASQGGVLFENPSIVLLMIGPGIVYFATIFVIALGVSRAAGLSYPETALMVFTTAARNSEISLAVAVTAFASPLIALTVVIGPAIELPVLVAMLKLLTWLRGRRLLASAHS